MAAPANRMKYVEVPSASSTTTYEVIPSRLQNAGFLASLPTLTQDETIALTSWVDNNYLSKTGKAADADKLDGYDSTYYLDYNHLTNKPWLWDEDDPCHTEGYVSIYDDYEDHLGRRPPNSINHAHDLDLTIYSTGFSVYDQDDEEVYQYSFPQHSGTIAMTNDIGLTVLDLRGYVDGSN